jgi:hypothetical protein
MEGSRVETPKRPTLSKWKWGRKKKKKKKRKDLL